jgi:hypothetical protein
MKETISKETHWENRIRAESTTTPANRNAVQLGRNNHSYRYMECCSARNGNCCSAQNKGNVKEKEKESHKLETLKHLIVRPIFKSLLLQNSS